MTQRKRVTEIEQKQLRLGEMVLHVYRTPQFHKVCNFKRNRRYRRKQSAI